MGYKLKIPTAGFDQFSIFFYPDDPIEGEYTLKLLDSTYLLEKKEILDWLRSIGWPDYSSLIDYCTTYVRIDCTYLPGRCSFKIPDDQRHIEQLTDEVTNG